MSESAAAELVKRAVLAAANGPFFPEWEFGTLFGLTRAELASAANHVETSSSASGQAAATAAAAAVNNLLGYPHGQDQLLAQWLCATPAELEAAFGVWSLENGA